MHAQSEASSASSKKPLILAAASTFCLLLSACTSNHQDMSKPVGVANSQTSHPTQPASQQREPSLKAKNVPQVDVASLMGFCRQKMVGIKEALANYNHANGELARAITFQKAEESQKAEAESKTQESERLLQELIPKQYQLGGDLIESADILSRCDLAEIKAILSRRN